MRPVFENSENAHADSFAIGNVTIIQNLIVQNSFISSEKEKEHYRETLINALFAASMGGLGENRLFAGSKSTSAILGADEA
ncbi:hypothetical protein [Alteromonas sp. ASW11-130]|uniref:hypothetical protein n=1 Tax=Alteromonas sp. ASW11-130 TaxID=3015775 RepID=UPI002242BD48|nr:hypothetical protein [Alteromonas sp. ASW11-130]MCW8090218.1 hypothetical protein [Alteromonas sp. ASW11-130]